MKVTTPLALEGPDAAETVEEVPPLGVRVTVAPITGLLLASSSVTVTVEVVTPSSTTLVGTATTVEVPAPAGPKNTTVGVMESGTALVVSVAV